MQLGQTMRQLAAKGATVAGALYGQHLYDVVCFTCGAVLLDWASLTEEHCPGASAAAIKAWDEKIDAIRRRRQDERLASRPTVLSFDGGET